MENEKPQFEPRAEVSSSDSGLHRICDAGDALIEVDAERTETERTRHEFLKALEAGGTDLSDENDPMTALLDEVEAHSDVPMTDGAREEFSEMLLDYWT